MKCPRCSGPITTRPDEAGFILCPQCGARLRSRTTAVVKIHGSAEPKPPAPAPPADADSVMARLERAASPSATLPPGTPLKKIPRPEERAAGAAGTAGAADDAAAHGTATLELLLEEIRGVRRLQEEILAALEARPPAGPAGHPVTPLDDPFEGFQEDAPSASASAAPVRSRRRKSVLLIDDDSAERAAVVQALELADVPVKTAVDGNGGLAAIAMEKPDVIVLELGLSGSMAGKDIINMIKATMEWVDIPIVLYTRMPVASQKEARIEHGADDYVLKGASGPQNLVNKVIALFRRL
jgi:CheY-like chemotaxis protein